jgi:uncharacterized transporter YbjL
MTKWILSSVVFILSLAITGFIGFYVAIFLVGPHSDILPEVIHAPVGIMLLIIIIGFPAWLGRKIFVQVKRKEKNNLST